MKKSFGFHNIGLYGKLLSVFFITVLAISYVNFPVPSEDIKTDLQVGFLVHIQTAVTLISLHCLHIDSSGSTY